MNSPVASAGLSFAVAAGRFPEAACAAAIGADVAAAFAEALAWAGAVVPADATGLAPAAAFEAAGVAVPAFFPAALCLAEGVAFAPEPPGATMLPRPEEAMPPMETVRCESPVPPVVSLPVAGSACAESTPGMTSAPRERADATTTPNARAGAASLPFFFVPILFFAFR